MDVPLVDRKLVCHKPSQKAKSIIDKIMVIKKWLKI